MTRFTEDDILSNLNKYFDHDCLRPGQLAVIRKIFENKDLLVCKESGFGKSLCYQLSGLMRPGIVIVISPLRSRAEEKCSDLAEFNIKCTCLSSSVKSKPYENEQDLRGLLSKKNKVLDDLRNWMSSGLKFLFVTHEYFVNSSRLQQIIKDLYKNKFLQAIVLDDVHCTKQFRKEFPKDYSILGKLRDSCPDTSFLCFVKPLSNAKISMIRDTLNLKRPYVLNEPAVNGNVSYKVLYTGDNYDFDQMVGFVKDTFPNKTGIIYCRNESACLFVSQKLKDANIRNLYYHACLSDDDKNWLEWITAEGIVITSVTGSNVDIHLQNVSYVVHAFLPTSLDIYMQETSKVGRSEKSSCVLFYNSSDSKINIHQMAESYREKMKHASSSESAKMYKAEFNENARLMYDAAIYAENSFVCRQVYLLTYLNEENAVLPCGVCDVCHVMKRSFVIDMSFCMRKILMAVWAINTRQLDVHGKEEFYNVDVGDLVDLLIGSAKKNLARSDFTKEWFFASFSSWDQEVLQRLIFVLLGNKFASVNFVFNKNLQFKARNLVIATKGQAFVKSTNEFNIPFSRKDFALTKWLNFDRIIYQFKRDLESVVLYYSLQQENHYLNIVGFVCDLLGDCPDTWEKFRIMKAKYTQNVKCDFDEDLFTVCLMYHQIIRKVTDVNNESTKTSEFRLENPDESHCKLFRRL